MTQRSRWWDRTVHADRRPLLLARNRIRDAIRNYFDGHGFIEVDCTALQVSPGNEAHLHAFATERIATDGARQRMFLHTSPEFACKKLLAAGERKIYSFGPVYRNRERGDLHAPEFTMLEWYRAEETYGAVIEDCIAVVKLAAETAQTGMFRFRDRQADPFAAAERITVSDAFRNHADIDLLATILKTGPDAASLAAAAARAGIKTADGDSWTDIFSRVLVERIEPHLGIGKPTILDQYPRHEAALARATAHDPRLAERFELFICGVELANGFGELTDAEEQRRRFEAEMDEKARIYGERYPLDEDFLAALAMMPPACGIALGLDRLVMLATGAARLDEVLWNPLPRNLPIP